MFRVGVPVLSCSFLRAFCVSGRGGGGGGWEGGRGKGAEGRVPEVS